MEGDQLKDPEKLPPGFRFHPSDEELITYYLVNKISDSTFLARAIGEVDLNKCEPWDLPGKAKMGEKEWYFFCLRDRKYPTGVRTNRATNTGYWKTTGKDKEIFNSTTSELIGMKKTLVFYRGRAPRGEKTNWVMHEYRIHSKSAYRSAKDEWVVCRVFQKSGIKKYHTTTTQASRSTTNMGMSSMNMGGHGPPLIPIDPVQFPNMIGSRNNNNFMMDTLRTTMPFGSPHLNYSGVGGSFGLNLNLGSSGGVGSSVVPQQSMFRAPQHDVMMGGGAASTLAIDQNGFGVVDNRYANNVENCMEFEGYWPHYN